MILGFLAEGPMHGYKLRRKMSQLYGYARTTSEGTIYPAINRLLAAGALTQELEPGVGAASRRTLHLTLDGRARLEGLLRDADGHDITDGGRFFIVLAFLSLLPDEAERLAVLRRRMEFLDQPVGFFFDGDRPLRAAEIADPYRRGILVSARATRTAELAWLREQLGTTTDQKEWP
jgi:DNA-binding PadR family transcriptional regulator